MKTVFHKIVSKEIKAQIIYEDNRVIAFEDINPQRKGHFLVIPKKYAENLKDISNEDLSYLMLKTRELAVKRIENMQVKGFNLIVNSGKEAGQEIMYLHVHVIPSIK